MDLYCILNNSQGHLQEKPMGSENAKNPYWWKEVLGMQGVQ
jgi:hypothetical protein